MQILQHFPILLTFLLKGQSFSNTLHRTAGARIFFYRVLKCLNGREAEILVSYELDKSLCNTLIASFSPNTLSLALANIL